MEQLVEVTGRKYGVAHFIGPGVDNRFLSQLVADAIGMPVKTAITVEAMSGERERETRH